MSGPTRFEAFPLDTRHLLVEGVQQGDGWSVGRLLLRRCLLQGLEAEIQAATRNGQRSIVGPLRGDAKGQPRRQGDALLRPRQREVQSPSIHLHRSGGERGHAIHQQECVGSHFVYDTRDVLQRIQNTRQRIAHGVRFVRLAQIDGHLVGILPAGDGYLVEPFTESAADQTQYATRGAVANRGLHQPGSR